MASGSSTRTISFASVTCSRAAGAFGTFHSARMNAAKTRIVRGRVHRQHFASSLLRERRVFRDVRLLGTADAARPQSRRRCLIEYVTEIRTFEYIVDTLVRRIDLSNPRASVSEARAYRHASPDPRWRI